MQIYERALGPEHPYLAATRTNYADLRRKQGATNEARTLLESTLAMRERALGPTHPELAYTLIALSSLARANEDFASARALLERALALREAAFGQDHSRLCSVLTSLAEIYGELDESEHALATYARTLAIYAASGQSGYGHAVTLRAMGAYLRTLGEPERALVQLERARTMFIDAFGDEHLHVATLAIDICRAQLDMQQAERARRTCERALAIVVKGEQTPAHAHTRMWLELALLPALTALEQHEAAAALADALTLRLDARAPDLPEIRDALEAWRASQGQRGD